MKRSDKFLLVLAKNKLRIEIYQKILKSTYENLKRKWKLLPTFCRPLPVYTGLENFTVFLQFLRVLGMGASPLTPGGAPGVVFRYLWDLINK